jgi:uncharacterized protein (DUF1778 family)
MTVTARFDLKMDAAEKDLVARAAALMGTTMAGFVRAAAKEKATELIERETRVTLSKRDFDALARALDRPFKPNKALKEALEKASNVRRA